MPDLRAGAVASLTSATTSAVSGGLTTIAGAALIGLLVPSLAAFRSPARPALHTSPEVQAGQRQAAEPPPEQLPGRPEHGPLIPADNAAPGHQSDEPRSS